MLQREKILENRSREHFRDQESHWFSKYSSPIMKGYQRLQTQDIRKSSNGWSMNQTIWCNNSHGNRFILSLVVRKLNDCTRITQMRRFDGKFPSSISKFYSNLLAIATDYTIKIKNLIIICSIKTNMIDKIVSNDQRTVHINTYKKSAMSDFHN